MDNIAQVIIFTVTTILVLIILTAMFVAIPLTELYLGLTSGTIFSEKLIGIAWKIGFGLAIWYIVSWLYIAISLAIIRINPVFFWGFIIMFIMSVIVSIIMNMIWINITKIEAFSIVASYMGLVKTIMDNLPAFTVFGNVMSALVGYALGSYFIRKW